MEKRKPHFKLELVKQAVVDQRYRFTRVALEGGAELGMEMADMLAVISALGSRDFFQEHDNLCGSYYLAGRLPTRYRIRAGLPEVHAGGRSADRFI